LDGVRLEPVNEVKLLGVLLDRHLTMANHIDDTVTKCHGLLGVLRRASKVLPRDLLKLTFTSLVRSRMEYSSAVFAMAAPSHLAKLDTVQKIAARVITNSDPRTHSAPLLDELGLESLHVRRSKHISMIVSNILEGKAHPFFNGFFDDKDPNSSSPKVHSRTRSKRFKFFGITTHELSKTTSITNQHNLQSLLLGRQITTFTTAQSAPAQTNTVNLQVTPVHALATPNFTSLQNEALVVDALGDHGGRKDTYK